jgi:alpha-ribazole phosphatase
MSLWLVRHAQPLVAPGVCYGALDVPADADSTARAAHALSAVLPQNLFVQVSLLQRCEQLAQCLRGLRPDLTFKTDARLQEMDFGVWEGVAWSDIPRGAMEAWTADFGHHRFGGAESANAVLQRVAQVWDACRTAAQPAVWITHAGVIRAAKLIAAKRRAVERAEDWPREAPAFGAWQTLALD